MCSSVFTFLLFVFCDFHTLLSVNENTFLAAHPSTQACVGGDHRQFWDPYLTAGRERHPFLLQGFDGGADKAELGIFLELVSPFYHQSLQLLTHLGVGLEERAANDTSGTRHPSDPSSSKGYSNLAHVIYSYNYISLI